MIELNEVPANNGCYLFKDALGKIIYVGKAKDLSKRVKSYFQKREHDNKTRSLVSNISSVDFFITDNEVEALILENNLIKKFKPKYNIDLKDSKRYAYVQITDEEFPRLLLSRKRGKDGKYYGPFVSGASRDYVMDALIKIFGIRTCNKMPKKECLRFAIGICSAPCTAKISKTDYLERVQAARLVLKGRTRELIKILDENMKHNSKIMNYEGALELKNQIESVKALEGRQKMERDKDYDEDIINYIVVKDNVHLMIFNSLRGIIHDKKEFDFPATPNFLEEFLVQYYSDNEIPRKIIIPTKVDDSIEDYLKKLNKKKVEVVIPKKGTSKELLDLVLKNLEQ